MHTSDFLLPTSKEIEFFKRFENNESPWSYSLWILTSLSWGNWLRKKSDVDCVLNPEESVSFLWSTLAWLTLTWLYTDVPNPSLTLFIFKFYLKRKVKAVCYFDFPCTSTHLWDVCHFFAYSFFSCCFFFCASFFPRSALTCFSDSLNSHHLLFNL